MEWGRLRGTGSFVEASLGGAVTPAGVHDRAVRDGRVLRGAGRPVDVRGVDGDTVGGRLIGRKSDRHAPSDGDLHYGPRRARGRAGVVRPVNARRVDGDPGRIVLQHGERHRRPAAVERRFHHRAVIRRRPVDIRGVDGHARDPVLSGGQRDGRPAGDGRLADRPAVGPVDTRSVDGEWARTIQRRRAGRDDGREGASSRGGLRDRGVSEGNEQVRIGEDESCGMIFTARVEHLTRAASGRDAPQGASGDPVGVDGVLDDAVRRILPGREDGRPSTGD